MVMQYKDLIREQDKKLHDLQMTVERLRHENHMVSAQNDELNNSLAQLRDQNMVLRAQVSAAGTNEWEGNAGLRAELENKDAIVKRLSEELNEARLVGSLQKTSMEDNSNQNHEETQRLHQELEEAQRRIAQLSADSEELSRLKRDQEDLLELLADQDVKLGNFKLRLRALGEKLDEDEDLDDDPDTANEDQVS